MAFTEYTGDTTIIGALGTNPSERGLTTQEFKDKFDQFAHEFVAWFNATHVVEANAHLAENAIDAHAVMPAARVYHSTNQSIPNAAYTKLSFDSKRFDTDNIHDDVNNTRLTCRTSGKYLIVANVVFEPNSSGERELLISFNGSLNIARQSAPVSEQGSALSVATVYDMVVGDYVEVFVYQQSGGALDVIRVPNQSAEFMMVKVG